MRLLALPAATLAILALTTALPSPQSSKPLPLLIWHGLGDRYDAEGLHSVGELAQKIHPGTYVHYIKLNEEGDEDRKATFFGNVTAQIEQVCEDLHDDKELRKAAGGKELLVDAIGFSQGGQFLRGLLQTCEGLSIRNLITFGSQHNGIAAIKACGTWDLLCKGALALMRSNAWTPYVQSNVVPAQYYRTLNETTGLASEEYLESSGFLADINNERPAKNSTYKDRLVNNLKGKFVMFVFEDDTTVIPLESGWFSEVLYNKTSEGEEERIVVPLRERPIYKEDWLGLKVLDERGSLVFRKHPGDHMQLDERVLEETFGEFLGPLQKGEKGEKEKVGDDEVKFECTTYQLGYLEGWWWEVRNAWEAWRGRGVWKQGL